MRPWSCLSLPAVTWLFLTLPAFLLAEDALEVPEEKCAQEKCDIPSSDLETLFEDEQPPLSLLQTKAKQIKARVPPSASAPKTSSSTPSKAQAGGISIGVSLDSRSGAFMFHSICASIRERAQISVFILGCILLVALSTRSLKKFRKKGVELQAQVCVDHFVTHSQLSTSKREALKTPPMVDVAGGFQLSDAQRLSAALGEGVELLCSKAPVAGPSLPIGSLTAVCPRELREVSSAPLDASFVLPLCETWYAVCVEPMAMCDGAFDILRIAGYPALHGTVRHADGFRVLEITCSSCPTKQGQILASVSIETAAPSPTGSQITEAHRALKVVGAGGKHYGHIRPQADGGYTLSCGQEDVISLAAEEGQCLALRTTEAKKEIASASWFEQSDFFSGAGHLAVRINPNADTILVLACTLALTILGGDKNLLRFTRPADRGAG